jgi:hypothetical protein
MRKLLVTLFLFISVSCFADWSIIKHELRVSDIFGRYLVDWTLQFDQDTIRIPIVHSVYETPQQSLDLIQIYYDWYKRDPEELKAYALSRYETKKKRRK